MFSACSEDLDPHRLQMQSLVHRLVKSLLIVRVSGGARVKNPRRLICISRKKINSEGTIVNLNLSLPRWFWLKGKTENLMPSGWVDTHTHTHVSSSSFLAEKVFRAQQMPSYLLGLLHLLFECFHSVWLAHCLESTAKSPLSLGGPPVLRSSEGSQLISTQ